MEGVSCERSREDVREWGMAYKKYRSGKGEEGRLFYKNKKKSLIGNLERRCFENRGGNIALNFSTQLVKL